MHAGDVIGYVGDTGDAVGTPHDHFEFHPNVMPAPGTWPESAYGYAIIEDAVNPYPLLVRRLRLASLPAAQHQADPHQQGHPSDDEEARRDRVGARPPPVGEVLTGAGVGTPPTTA